MSVGQLQWAAPGIQLIGRSERTLCPAVLSNSSTDNCSQDMCECVCVCVGCCSSILVRTGFSFGS